MSYLCTCSAAQTSLASHQQHRLSVYLSFIAQQHLHLNSQRASPRYEHWEEKNTWKSKMLCHWHSAYTYCVCTCHFQDVSQSEMDGMRHEGVSTQPNPPWSCLRAWALLGLGCLSSRRVLLRSGSQGSCERNVLLHLPVIPPALEQDNLWNSIYSRDPEIHPSID